MLCRLFSNDWILLLILVLFTIIAANKILALLWNAGITARVCMLAAAGLFLIAGDFYSTDKSNPLSIVIHVTVALLLVAIGASLGWGQVKGRNSDKPKGSHNV